MKVGFIAKAREQALWLYLRRAGDLADAVQSLPGIVPHASAEALDETYDEINAAIQALYEMRGAVRKLKEAYELDNVEFPVRGVK